MAGLDDSLVTRILNQRDAMDDDCNTISALTAEVPNEEFDRRMRELQQHP